MSEELKYPHEWFELLKSEIPQPFRFEIDDNLNKEFANYEKCAKIEFLFNAYGWGTKVESIDYWCNVYNAFMDGTLQQLADKVNKGRWDTLKVGDTLYSITKDGREGIVTEKYLTEALAVLQVGKKDNYIGYENWFNYWTPIKPKHWKEENNRELPIHNEEGEIIANNSEELNEKEQDAIYFLKSLGYKILKPVTNYEEI